MGKRHDVAVEEMYDRFLAVINESPDGVRWDEVRREVEYYSPDEESKYYDNPLGEMDVCLVNHDDREIYYLEVKTRPSDIGDAKDQLERAQDHFEEWGWEFYGDYIVADETTEYMNVGDGL